MSASTTVRRPSHKATADKATADATAPDTTAAPDSYPGALPPAETTASAASEQTGIPADRMADQVKDAVNTTLQNALGTDQAPAPPAVDSETVTTHQLACFDRAIGRARALAYDENRTTIDIGADLQEAIDSFKSLVPKNKWWKQRAGTISDYETRFRLRMAGRAAQAYRMLACYHVHRLASPDAQTAIVEGRDGAPFPLYLLETIGKWVAYDKSDDTYSIKAGYQASYNELIVRVAEEGLSLADLEREMQTVENRIRLVQAETNGGREGKTKETKVQTSEMRAARNKALDRAADTFVKAVKGNKVGGATPAEILLKLSDRGFGDVSGLFDPATITTTEALAFAQRLCDLDRAEIIYVMLQRFRAYETAALANKQDDKPAAPALNDAPGTNGAAK